MRSRLVALGILLALAGHAGADEVQRVRAHLLNARALLDRRDVSALSPEHLERRAAAIAVLDRYIVRGVFPRRTGDPYGSLRPRFIDDRGLHCAVGEMIAETGAPELANLINAEFEYAFVREMKSAALLAWADEHGFTVDELAAIQPSYAKWWDHQRRGVSEDFWAHVSDIAISCLTAQPLPTQVELSTTYDSKAGEDIKWLFTTKATDAFSKCFAAAATSYAEPSGFGRPVKITIPSLESLMEMSLVHATCTPTTGPIPKTAQIDFAKATVTTAPSNAEAEACLARYLDQTVIAFHRRVALQVRSEIRPKIGKDQVESLLLDHTPGAAWKCAPNGDPQEIRALVRAKEGDTAFSISLPGANPRFESCVVEKIEPPLRKLVTSSTAGRIDSDVEATLTFKLVHEP